MIEVQKESNTKQVFDFFVRFPSSSAYEAQNNLELGRQQCATIVNSLYKRGLLDRKRVINRNTDIPRKHVYKYWATTQEFKRVQKITPKSLRKMSNEIMKSLAMPPQPMPSTPKPPPQIRPAPPETNTDHHNVTVTISAHPALLKLVERLAAIL
jgi:predicted transcriptional regulator